jgi:hypothetical protein
MECMKTGSGLPIPLGVGEPYLPCYHSSPTAIAKPIPEKPSEKKPSQKTPKKKRDETKPEDKPQ